MRKQSGKIQNAIASFVPIGTIKFEALKKKEKIKFIIKIKLKKKKKKKKQSTTERTRYKQTSTDEEEEPCRQQKQLACKLDMF